MCQNLSFLGNFYRHLAIFFWSHCMIHSIKALYLINAILKLLNDIWSRWVEIKCEATFYLNTFASFEFAATGIFCKCWVTGHWILHRLDLDCIFNVSIWRYCSKAIENCLFQLSEYDCQTHFLFVKFSAQYKYSKKMTIKIFGLEPGTTEW